MDLQPILDQYFATNLRIADEQTRRKYRYSLENFAVTLGHPPRTRDLSDDAVMAMMVRLRDNGLSPATINDRRARVCALWTWCAKRGLVDRWPTVPQLREPKRVPVAWTLDEMNRLLDACIAQPGLIGEIPASLWWTVLVLLAWDSGERVSALVAIEWRHISGEWLLIPAELRKGKSQDMAYRLSEQTQQALNMVAFPKRTKVLPWPYNPLYLWARFGKVLTAAGLPNDRRHKFHCIRRSVASHVMAFGGDASQVLGHSSPAVTAAYLDPRITRQRQPVDYLPRLTRDNPRPPGDDRRRA